MKKLFLLSSVIFLMGCHQEYYYDQPPVTVTHTQPASNAHYGAPVGSGGYYGAPVHSSPRYESRVTPSYAPPSYAPPPPPPVSSSNAHYGSPVFNQPTVRAPQPAPKSGYFSKRLPRVKITPQPVEEQSSNAHYGAPTEVPVVSSGSSAHYGN